MNPKCRFKYRGNCEIKRERCKFFGTSIKRCKDMEYGICKLANCKDFEYAKGLCSRHYEQRVRKGIVNKTDVDLDEIMFGPREKWWWKEEVKPIEIRGFE